MTLSFAQFEREVTGERIRDKIGWVSSMPIWVIVITLVIALYGAVLSTLNFLRAGPRLRDRPTTLTNITIRAISRNQDRGRVCGIVPQKAAVLTR